MADHVANEWVEPYDLLSQAIARLAVLIFCGESAHTTGFLTTDTAQFAADAAVFHRSVTR